MPDSNESGISDDPEPEEELRADAIHDSLKILSFLAVVSLNGIEQSETRCLVRAGRRIQRLAQTINVLDDVRVRVLGQIPIVIVIEIVRHCRCRTDRFQFRDTRSPVIALALVFVQRDLSLSAPPSRILCNLRQKRCDVRVRVNESGIVHSEISETFCTIRAEWEWSDKQSIDAACSLSM